MLRNPIESYIRHRTDMPRVLVCMLGCFLWASAHQSNQPLFTFKTLSSIFRRNSDDCKICYGNHDCMTMDKSRCEYYMEVEEVLQEAAEDEDDVNPALRESVDAMLFDLVEKANLVNGDCLPYISEFTDCTKENVCTGCTRCSCDAHGEWNCSMIQRCQADDVLNVDHRVLVSVLENLNNNELLYRIKRAVTGTPSTQNNDSKIYTNEELSKWLYGVNPVSNDTEPKETKFEIDNEVNDVNNNNKSFIDTVSNTTPNMSEHQTDIDYLAFDEVLNNIAVDPKIYSRRKPPLDADHNETVDMDYMNVEAINVTTTNTIDSKQFMNMLNEIEGMDTNTVAPTEGVTEVFIDLLESAKKYRFKYNETDYMTFDEKIDNNIDEFNVINVMKREISNTTDTIEISTTEKIDNGTENAQELKDNVLQPLADIISKKEKELQELLRVKGNLITFMKSFNNADIELNFKDNKTENNRNTYFSIYKMEVIPEFEYDLRKKNPQILDKYLYKLKRDIYEVIRDVVGIQKISDNANLPEELKILIRAMKHYIRKSKKNNTLFKHQNKRKQFHADLSKRNPQSTKNCVVEIFELLDKDMPEANALSPLSQKAKKILKRIIKNNHVEEFAAIGIRLHGADYNLTNDLSMIGSTWPKAVLNVVVSSLQDRLYAMKSLYLMLSVDISKITDALTLIDFAHSRRSFDPETWEQIVKKILASLKTINDKINILAEQQQNKRTKQRVINVDETKNQKQIAKESFMKQLRKLFKNSKNDIIGLLKKNVPKSEIVKELAKNKLTNLTRRKLAEYEEVMKRWQLNLDIVPKRYKRSLRARKKIKNRIKNIIPKYLRGKVSPAIVAKGSKKVTKKGKPKKNSNKIAATTMKSEIRSKKPNNKTKTQ